MNIAVLVPNWIGDAVMATPALRALRKQFRGSRMIGVLKPYVSDVLAGGDWFDELIPHNGGAWSQGVLATAQQLSRLHVDLAVVFPNSFRAALTAWQGGCKQRIGYARSCRSWLLTDALPAVRDDRGRFKPSPILDAYNRLAERAGCAPPGRRMELFTTSTDEAIADEVWRRAAFASYREVICLNPGAAFGAAKYWPEEHFAALARDLAKRRGSGILVLCGPSEREQARRIITLARHPAVLSLAETAPALSVGLTKACVRRADLLVTTDSGPRHFAAAFDRSVVTLFGPTHIAWTETYYARAIHLQKEVPCGPCQLRECPLDHRCMNELLPADVFAAAERLLGGRIPLAG